MDLYQRLNPEKLLFTFLYLGWMGFGLGLYSTEQKTLFRIQIGSLLLFTAIISWAFVDLRRQRKYLRSQDDSDIDLEDIHFLCADPLCLRCKGYYIGLSSSTMITLTLYRDLIRVTIDYNLEPYTLILIGGVVFLISSPIHGAFNSAARIILSRYNMDTTPTQSNILKFTIGVISGLSFVVIVIGVLRIL